ncbi:NAD(P)/FAD-dependent oxidoreductase [Pseudoalteromonas galatheae]|uniref:NAD(P)/FAD-dependent oxidoreductase n=1 Tax=Pseudoalteromonas galatheae TaxID=579562 RepID=UPI001107BE4F|nr:FAD-dependent oxidoreductase [Pseudoalteromonas galatheae]NKC17353.1 pyridine nucleotide-disulfide oxidoreductase [Pseudoalteromonas galatheae]
MNKANRFLIIGAGQAASQLALSLRKEGWQGDITMLAVEATSLYQKPFLSKSYLTGEKSSDAIRIKPLTAYQKKGIEIIDNAHVRKLDRHKKQIELSNEQQLDYEKLAICSGATPRQLAIPGSDKQNIFYLNTLTDANLLKQFIAQHRPQSAVVVGGGFIGLEAASSLTKLGLNVTLLEHEERVLNRVCSKSVGKYLSEIQKENGVKILTHSKATEFTGGKKVEGVVTAAGLKVDCDLVLIGIGVQPNTHIAEQAELKVDNGIATDNNGLTNDPCIYAAGDCASQFSTDIGQYMRIESVQNAISTAKRIAAHACNQPEPKSELPWFWSDQFDTKLQIAGLASNYTHTIERVESNKLSLWYFSHEKLVATECINHPSAFIFAKQAIVKGLRLEQEKLQNSEYALADTVIKQSEKEIV